MKFLGIDLGWRSGASGSCCLQQKSDRLQILDLDRIEAIADILAWIDKFAPQNTNAIIAVDAPTIIPNATGMRLPDKLAHKYFGRYHAGCYPANLNRPFAERTVEFGKSLENKGFVHAPTIKPQKLGRYQIEVYPHPAIVNLFKLDRILKYKKGKLADRKEELLKLHRYIIEVLPTLQPALEINQLIAKSPAIKNMASLKEFEDKLDSLICAYVAANWWYWGEEKNLVMGDRSTGYIVVPSLNKA